MLAVVDEADGCAGRPDETKHFVWACAHHYVVLVVFHGLGLIAGGRPGDWGVLGWLIRGRGSWSERAAEEEHCETRRT